MNNDITQSLRSTEPAHHVTPAEIDPELQKKAATLAMYQHWLSLADTGIGFLFIIFILITGAHLRLRNLLISTPLNAWTPVQHWHPLLVAVYGLLFIIVPSIVLLPLAYFRGFVLLHKFGLSRQSVFGWAVDLIKSALIGAIFTIALIEILYLLIAIFPNIWWLWAAVGMLFASIVLSFLLPILGAPLFYTFIPLPEGELRQRLLTMANRAKTHIQGVYVLKMSKKTTAGNAAVMGLGNTRRIVIGDTILQEYSPREIEIILAHEIGHQAHNDLWKGIFFSSILTFIMLAIANSLLHSMASAPILGLHSLTDIATLPLLGLLTGGYTFLLGPLQNTFSRIIEYQADHFALDLTGDPENFKSAFRRLANQNLSQLEPHRLIEIIFYDHPAIGKRIYQAELWEQRHRSSQSPF